MKSITQEELDSVLELHKKYLSKEKSGQCANLRHTDLSKLNLKYVNLKYANLEYSNLKGTNLDYANLEGANLEQANLSDAHLSNANLRGAYLCEANLSVAYLYEADLEAAQLDCANLNYAYLENANLNRASLTLAITNETRGTKIVSAQVRLPNANSLISFYVDLEIWTIGNFQGSSEELTKYIEKICKNKEFLKQRYKRAIEFILKEVAFDKLEDNECLTQIN